MNIIARYGRALLLAAVLAVVGAVWLSGCGEDIKGPDVYADENDDGTLWNDWIVTTQPTCNAPGMETRTDARNPNHKETRDIAQLTGAACNSSGGGTYEFVDFGGLKVMKRNLDIVTPESWCYGEGGQEIIDDWNGNDNQIEFRTLSSAEIQANCSKYGRLYTWAAAKAACQSIGWRLPSVSDMERAVSFVIGDGMTLESFKSTSGWNTVDGVNGNGTDMFGYSALPGGFRVPSEFPSGRSGFSVPSEGVLIYAYSGFIGVWWMDNVGLDADYAASLAERNESPNIVFKSNCSNPTGPGCGGHSANRNIALSVRCAKD